MTKKAFDELIGKTVDFYGVDNNVLCVGTVFDGRMAFEAVEDEADGYRSMLDEVKQVPLTGHIFFRTPVTKLNISEITSPGFSGYVLTDASGHVWLRLGTNCCDDYYPCFTFDYTPIKGTP